MSRRIAPPASPIFRRIAPPSDRRSPPAPPTISRWASSAPPPLARGGLVNPGAMAEWARELIRRFAIRIPSERVAVGTLSGGNLQKVVVARELSHEAPVLIAEQPTRGLDVGATEFIHDRLVAERDNGRAVLLVSAELSEILALSDRVLVMFEGRILADLPQEEADEETRRPPYGGADAGGGVNGARDGGRLHRACGRRPSSSRSCSRRWLGGALVLASGANPLQAYAEIVAGSLSPRQSARHAQLGDAARRHDARRGDPAARRHGQPWRRRPAGHRRPDRRAFAARPAGARRARLHRGARRGGARRGPLRLARRVGRNAPRHPDADLEPAAELSGRGRDLLSRALSHFETWRPACRRPRWFPTARDFMR